MIHLPLACDSFSLNFQLRRSAWWALFAMATGRYTLEEALTLESGDIVRIEQKDGTWVEAIFINSAEVGNWDSRDAARWASCGDHRFFFEGNTVCIEWIVWILLFVVVVLMLLIVLIF